MRRFNNGWRTTCSDATEWAGAVSCLSRYLFLFHNEIDDHITANARTRRSKNLPCIMDTRRQSAFASRKRPRLTFVDDENFCFPPARRRASVCAHGSDKKVDLSLCPTHSGPSVNRLTPNVEGSYPGRRRLDDSTNTVLAESLDYGLDKI
jgi:hypothetical protein